MNMKHLIGVVCGVSIVLGVSWTRNYSDAGVRIEPTGLPAEQAGLTDKEVEAYLEALPMNAPDIKTDTSLDVSIMRAPTQVGTLTVLPQNFSLDSHSLLSGDDFYDSSGKNYLTPQQAAYMAEMHTAQRIREQVRDAKLILHYLRKDSPPQPALPTFR